ncbi:MAG: hypothetical protein WBG30_06860 [Psychrilyobacter sp.]|uniref:hypothetical protein n=1 Tax=Psychrilyobacter sp. TaxID=2586924 RepID=UPI003C74D7CE
MKTQEQYEKQIIKSLDKVSFEMKKIKFLIFLAKHINKLRRSKSTILKIFILLYSIVISYFYFFK